MISDSDYQTVYALIQECTPSWLTIESRDFCAAKNSGVNLLRKDGGLEMVVSTVFLPLIKVYASGGRSATLSIEDPDFEIRYEAVIRSWSL